MGWKGPLEIILSSLLLHKCPVSVDQELSYRKQLLNNMHRDRLIPDRLRNSLGSCRPGGLHRSLVSPKGRGPARDGRIRVGGLQGTLLRKQCKQMLAGVPQAAVPAADGAC